jgi:glycosyltransferase involved in cell wall biosynthesis
MTEHRADLHANKAWQALKAAPGVTVVVPFFEFDVAPLIGRLLDMAAAQNEPVALLFVDDASRSDKWWKAAWDLMSGSEVPCCVGVLHKNLGRARIRNFLAQLTESPYLLYLDADMWPDRPDFLSLYLNWITERSPSVIYGGRSAAHVTATGKEYELHRLFTEMRESIPAAVRREAPAYSFYSCNFLAKREIIASYPLNEEFRGWGWEDCEWAMRVSKVHAITHEDNPASHLGLLTPAQILKKYDESVENFARFFALYPEVVLGTALYKVARLLGMLHGAPLAKALSRWLAVTEWLPARLRLIGLMVYKSSLYAKVVR